MTNFNLWFLVLWIESGTGSLFIAQGQFYNTDWSKTVGVAGLALSMTVNALVTGLIAFRIFKVFREVKTATANDQILGVTGGSTLRRVVFILIESGMALFSIQLVRLVVTIVKTDGAQDAYYLINGVHGVLNVIIISVIDMLFHS